MGARIVSPSAPGNRRKSRFPSLLLPFLRCRAFHDLLPLLCRRPSAVANRAYQNRRRLIHPRRHIRLALIDRRSVNTEAFVGDLVGSGRSVASPSRADDLRLEAVPWRSWHLRSDRRQNALFSCAGPVPQGFGRDKTNGPWPFHTHRPAKARNAKPARSNQLLDFA